MGAGRGLVWGLALIIAGLIGPGCAKPRQEPPGQPCLAAPPLPSPASPKTGMVYLPGGTFSMGAAAIHREEGPATPVTVRGFWIDQTEVTNAAFAAFVAATGYRTLSERALDPRAYPGLSPQQRQPSSMVFVGQEQSANRADPSGWWRAIAGADWRHPYGPDSRIEGMDQWPVVHVAYEDALAYARWLGRDLPTEAEWEYAARGGLEAKPYVWGDQPRPGGKPQANSWQGIFPMIDTGEDGYKAKTAPVGCYPANGFGLRDMSGNVWEWTRDWFKPGLSSTPGSGPVSDQAYDPADPAVPKHVVKGGSFLCSDDFCFRYRPAARSPGPADSGASHTGFRTVLRDLPKPDN